MTRQTLAVRTLVSVCLAVLPALVGCAGGGRSVSGHVLAGRASVVTVVAPDDARLSTPGVAGVTVRLTRGDGAATSLAETTSGADGSFELRVDDRYFYSRLELVAQGPDILACRGSVYLPADDRRVLVLVEPTGSHGVGEPAR